MGPTVTLCCNYVRLGRGAARNRTEPPRNPHQNPHGTPAEPPRNPRGTPTEPPWKTHTDPPMRSRPSLPESPWNPVGPIARTRHGCPKQISEYMPGLIMDTSKVLPKNYSWLYGSTTLLLFISVHRRRPTASGNGKVLLGQNYFPGLERVPVQENKKVTFLLLVSACRDSCRRRSCPPASRPAPTHAAGGRGSTCRDSCRRQPGALAVWAGVGTAQGGQLLRNAGPRKILKTMFLEPCHEVTHSAHARATTPPAVPSPSPLF